jgi:hypothetical protein
MTQIKRLNIKGLEFVFVGKYRYDKDIDDLERISTWKDWKLGFWFRKFEVVGSKNFQHPKEWRNNMVNQYMIGCELLLFQGWITICKGGMNLES